MAASMKEQQDSWATGNGSLIKADNRDYGFRCGYITTAYGAVGFYDQVERPRQTPHTSFDFCIDGRTHRITWTRTFSDRFLKTLAKRFAAEVADARG